VRLFNWRNWIH